MPIARTSRCGLWCPLGDVKLDTINHSINLCKESLTSKCRHNLFPWNLVMRGRSACIDFWRSGCSRHSPANNTAAVMATIVTTRWHCSVYNGKIHSVCNRLKWFARHVDLMVTYQRCANVICLKLTHHLPCFVVSVLTTVKCRKMGPWRVCPQLR